MAKLDGIKNRVHRSYELDEEQSAELRKRHEKLQAELRERPEQIPPISELSKRQVDHELASYIASAGPDERRVLLFICRRFIGIGQRDFGQLDLRAELRDGFQETAEEAADGLFYMSLWFLVQQINRPMTGPRDTEPGSLGPARYRNEAGQLIEDDDVPEEDWP